MKKIKIVYGISSGELQKNIDKWISDVQPDIINVSLSYGEGGTRSVAILYNDTQPIDTKINP